MTYGVENMPKSDQLLYAFAIGDALGAPLNFLDFDSETLTTHWLSDSKLTYSSESYLYLSTYIGLVALTNHLPTQQLSHQSWNNLKQSSLDFISSWASQKKVQPQYFTLDCALEQIIAHKIINQSFSEFRLDKTRDNLFALSIAWEHMPRMLPLIYTGISLDHSFFDFANLMHFDLDGKFTLDVLALWFKTSLFDIQANKNDRATPRIHSTLDVAIQALKYSDTPWELFKKSQHVRSRNSLQAALAFTLWVHKHGWHTDLDRHVARLTKSDRERLESATKGALLSPKVIFVEAGVPIVCPC